METEDIIGKWLVWYGSNDEYESPRMGKIVGINTDDLRYLGNFLVENSHVMVKKSGVSKFDKHKIFDTEEEAKLFYEFLMKKYKNIKFVRNEVFKKYKDWKNSEVDLIFGEGWVNEKRYKVLEETI